MTGPSLRRCLLLLVNGGLAGLALMTAFARQEPPPAPPQPASMRAPAEPAPSGPPDPGQAPDGQAPGDPFAGGQEDTKGRVPSAPPAPIAAAPSLSLVGTGLGAGSFAAMRGSAGLVVRLRAGEAVEGWTLEAVRRNEVVVTDGQVRWRIGFPPAGPAPCETRACPAAP